MKPTSRAFGLAVSISILLAAATPFIAQSENVIIPERFGVIDIIPNNESGETNQDSEPSLGVGVGVKYGDMIVHAFATVPTNYYYTTQSIGGPPWTNSGIAVDNDTTLDWSTAGTCYMASLFQGSLTVRQSSDPATVPFTAIPGSIYTAPPNNSYPDQPWVRVVNVTNVDHIFVAFNDLTRAGDFGGPGNTASIRLSLDGGSTWNNLAIEKTIPGAKWDSPQVRVAASTDGKTVYGMFQRASSWIGGPGNEFAADFVGDVVVMRDDGFGGSSFAALGGGIGTVVAHNIEIPYGGGVSLGAQTLGAQCAMVVDPAVPAAVYVAYTEVTSGVPVLRLQSSGDSGASFNLVYSITNASLPALAITKDGIVGLLYGMTNGNNLEVHFLKAFAGNFSPGSLTDRILARWPGNNPIRAGNPYIGDYFDIRAVGYNFFGTFSSSGNPLSGDFPSGVFYQRNVNVSGTVMSNFTLPSNGSLVDLSNHPVAPSIDPFVFYDIAPTILHLPVLEVVLPYFFDPIDPYSGLPRVNWPVLPENQPPILLQASSSLGAGANWAFAPAGTVAQANGLFSSALGGPESQQFYRLTRNLAGAQFNVFASVDGNGSLNQTGALGESAGASQTFTATPNNHYAVGNWYLDGVALQSAGPSITLTNITDEHTLVATFVASNDLAVTISEVSGSDGPTVTFSQNSYVINVENRGLSLLTGVSMTNNLPPTLSFVSASSTQGSVINTGSIVTASLGSLNPGASATISIQFMTSLSGSVTDTVMVACNQVEPDLSNNTATDITFVYDPVTITNQPASQSVPAGGGATFSVGVSGTPPFFYQWFFNSSPIANATGSALTLTDVTTVQAGPYSVSVYQMPAAEDIMEADSDAAILTVTNPPPPILTTFAATSVTTTTAVLNGSVYGNGSGIAGYFQYGLDTNYGSSTFNSQFFGTGNPVQDFSATISNLSPSTTYHYRIIAFNCCAEGFGADTNFTTAWAPMPPTLIAPGTNLPAGPTLDTLTPLFTWSADSQASSSDLIISQYPYGPANVVFSAGFGAASSFQIPSGFLPEGTAYAWYMVSFNSIGDESAASPSLYFQTPSVPTVQTLPATNITTGSATLVGNVNPNGLDTTVSFQYGTNTTYGNTAAAGNVGNGVNTVTDSRTVSELTGKGQIYHFRVVATNSLGASFGGDMQFTVP